MHICVYIYIYIYIYRICTYRKQHLGFLISVLYCNVSFSNRSFQSTKYSVDLSMSIYIDMSHSLFLSAENYSMEKTSTAYLVISY